MKRVQHLVVAAAAGLSFCGPALAGPDWVEQVDAGSVLSSAQLTRGEGSIRTIQGTLSGALLGPGGDFEDMYIVRVTEPTTFTFSLASANFNSALYLFNISQANEAFGLLGSDDVGESQGAILSGIATDGSGAQLTNPGIYALVITFSGNRAQSRTGDIFSFDTPTEITGPDGPGGTNPHEGWLNDAPFSGGEYIIDVVGSEFAEIPAPGTLALAALASAALARRRR
jgi:uncharacterized protein (TIGR03382 family)